MLLPVECLGYLESLLEFLAAWEKRPVWLTPMAYQWCLAISEAARTLMQRETSTPPEPLLPPFRAQLPPMPRRWFYTISKATGTLGKREIPTPLGSPHLTCNPLQEPSRQLRRQYRQRQQNLIPADLISLFESDFSKVGPGCDPFRRGDTSDRTRGHPLSLVDYADVLPVILEIGFHLAAPSRDQPAFCVDHTPHHDGVFETAFSSDDDEVVADAACAWIAGGYCTSPGSYVRYAAKRIEKDAPFSLRLRRVIICAIERNWRGELGASPLETIQLLNRLNVGVDDVAGEGVWAWRQILVDAIRSPTGLGSLSPHYWRVLDELQGPTVGLGLHGRDLESFDAVMRLLEEAEDWEKLEVWMLIRWASF